MAWYRLRFSRQHGYQHVGKLQIVFVSRGGGPFPEHIDPASGVPHIGMGPVRAFRNQLQAFRGLSAARSSSWPEISVSVSMPTDRIEYTSPAGGDNLAIERQGSGFFEKAVSDTVQRISADDRNRFLRWFTKENLEKEVRKQEVATNTFRLMDKNSTLRISMKVTRMQDSKRIILGVSIIDSEE